ncbi:AAA family ATPase [Rodentibacter pneumotropicus]|nr:AAA family ATPase [Rodentibacter pneumotropicus]
MNKSLDEIAEQLRDSEKKVNLIYAFNGNGKTRLSKAFKKLISPKNNDDNEETLTRKKILYFNAFTEDLFYWDNDLINDSEPKLKIQPNSFINWLIEDQGDEDKIISKFHHYCDEKLMPRFDIENNQITFSFARGNDKPEENIKLSKGEESNFIWSIFHTLIEQVVAELNIPESNERSTNEFDDLEYIFIDDPVSSLDENHLIQLAVDLAKLIKDSQSEIKFIITTHNPLFYNILHNEFSRLKGGCKTFRLEKMEDNIHYNLYNQSNDSPFAYQIHLVDKLESIFKQEIQIKEFLKEINRGYKNKVKTILKKDVLSENDLSEFYRLISNQTMSSLFYIRKNYIGNEFTLSLFKEKEIKECEVEKYHFNLIRNILEKLATFLGYREMKDMLPQDGSGPDPYMNRIVNLSSHSKHSGEETILISDNDKRVLKRLIEHLTERYKFRSKFIKLGND